MEEGCEKFHLAFNRNSFWAIGSVCMKFCVKIDYTHSYKCMKYYKSVVINIVTC